MTDSPTYTPQETNQSPETPENTVDIDQRETAESGMTDPTDFPPYEVELGPNDVDDEIDTDESEQEPDATSETMEPDPDETPELTAQKPEYTGDETEDEPAASDEAEQATEWTSQLEAHYGIELRLAVEAVIFASDEPLSFKQLRDVLFEEKTTEQTAQAEEPTEEQTPDQAVQTSETPSETEEQPRRGRKKKNAPRFEQDHLNMLIESLNGEYRESGRPFRIVEIAGGYCFQTTAEVGRYVGRLYAERMKRRLTQAALESLAIIAYKQPISKPSVEAIRGVSVDHVLKSLLERNLIEIVGRDETIGRPLLYGTTKEFLKHFGLKAISDLPKPREIEELLHEDEDLMPPIEETAEENDYEEPPTTKDEFDLFYQAQGQPDGETTEAIDPSNAADAASAGGEQVADAIPAVHAQSDIGIAGAMYVPDEAPANYGQPIAAEEPLIGERLIPADEVHPVLGPGHLDIGTAGAMDIALTEDIAHSATVIDEKPAAAEKKETAGEPSVIDDDAAINPSSDEIPPDSSEELPNTPAKQDPS